MGLMPGTTYSALPPPQVWTPPEIDVFDVSDDLEQKKFGSDARSDIQAPPLHLLKFGRPLK